MLTLEHKERLKMKVYPIWQVRKNTKNELLLKKTTRDRQKISKNKHLH